MTPTRRIVMFNRVSADGYFAAPDGNLDWAVPDPQLDRAAVEAFDRFDTVLLGRRTYDAFESFWPHALDDSPTARDPHDAGRRSPELRAMAVWLNQVTKLVFSRSRKEVTWKGTRLLRELDPRAIEQMKAQPGKDLIIFGSGSIVAELTRHGLIDEYQFAVSPILLGRGRSMIDGLPNSTRLELVEAKPYPAGNVVLRYARAE